MAARCEPEAEVESQEAADRALAEAVAAADEAADRLSVASVRAAAVAAARAAAAAQAKAAGGKGRARAKVAGGDRREPPRTLDGVLPPAPTSSGRRYYVLRAAHPGGVSVCVGYRCALHELGGSWFGAGAAPEGFAELESAVNAAICESGNQCGPREITVRY